MSGEQQHTIDGPHYDTVGHNPSLCWWGDTALRPVLGKGRAETGEPVGEARIPGARPWRWLPDTRPDGLYHVRKPVSPGRWHGKPTGHWVHDLSDDWLDCPVPDGTPVMAMVADGE